MVSTTLLVLLVTTHIKYSKQQYCALNHALTLHIPATCFLRMLFTFHKIPVTAATPMLGDCKASYDLITQDGASARTRFFERATLLIKRAVLMLILLPFHISTNFMVARPHDEGY